MVLNCVPQLWLQLQHHGFQSLQNRIVTAIAAASVFVLNFPQYQRSQRNYNLNCNLKLWLKHSWSLFFHAQVGLSYGSVAADILTSFKMHSRGWRSVYCMPKRPAFRGTAPINLTERLNQVLRWAVGSLEILFSRHCPLWYGFKEGRLKGLQRIAYINSTVYPFSSIPLLVYCLIPAICLLTDKFITPSVTNSLLIVYITIII